MDLQSTIQRQLSSNLHVWCLRTNVMICTGLWQFCFISECTWKLVISWKDSVGGGSPSSLLCIYCRMLCRMTLSNSYNILKSSNVGPFDFSTKRIFASAINFAMSLEEISYLQTTSIFMRASYVYCLSLLSFGTHQIAFNTA
jgi:hypothetical protein